jgi:hypothetical protein
MFFLDSIFVHLRVQNPLLYHTLSTYNVRESSLAARHDPFRLRNSSIRLPPTSDLDRSPCS